MPVTKPRTAEPKSEKECIELGKKLVEWAKKEKGEKEDYPRTSMAQFYTTHDILRKDWKTLIQRPEILPYYEKAQALLAARCKDPKVLREGFGQRYLRLYDRDLVDRENQEAREAKEFELRIKKELEQEGFNDPELVDRFQQMMKTLKDLQDKSDS